MGEKVIVLIVLRNLKNRLKLILGTTFLSVAAVWLLLAFMVMPDHEATSQILVESTAEEIPSQRESLPDPQIVDAYSAALKSPDILKKVIIDLELSLSIAELHKKITISHLANSQVINITAAASDGGKAAEIANKLATVFQEEIRSLMKTDNVTIISQASAPSNSSFIAENLVFNLGIAGAFGFIVGILLAVIVELLNTLLKTGKGERRKRGAELQTVFK